MADQTGKRAIICGGSIGGLFAAAALQRAGWIVDVYERSPQGLSGRGAGIVTHDSLLYALSKVGADTSEIGVDVEDRIAIDRAGLRVATKEHPQVVTSWDRIHSILKKLIPDAHYHLGRQCVGYRQEGGTATALFADGSEETADLLVGADGFRSAIRAQMLPEVQPVYAGYVVWRTLADQAAMSSAEARDVFRHFTFFAPAGTQALGYPIAGPDNDLRDGHLRYNLVWYCPTPEDQLKQMLTDATGKQHEISIPPPLITGATLDAMFARAHDTLPPVFLQVFELGERPFFTPIYDLHSHQMVDGRVVLVGDAACTARPHVGMGVTKAAGDAMSLAKHVRSGVLGEKLANFSVERSTAAHVAHHRGQMLGGWITEHDPDNPDGARNKRLTQIMDLTAAQAD